jgi:hypothetical protein
LLKEQERMIPVNEHYTESQDLIRKEEAVATQETANTVTLGQYVDSTRYDYTIKATNESIIANTMTKFIDYIVE